VCTTWAAAEDDESRLFPRARRDATQAEAKRSMRARCISCTVNGKLYDGHSRFQYEEGCSRFRCVCRCDGSWDCPAKYTENICKQSAAQEESQSQSSSSSHVSSSALASGSSSGAQRSGDGRCRSCIVDGKEQQGNSYFSHVEGCFTFDNCICYCNSSWVCPPERSRNTCTDKRLAASGDVTRTETRTVETEKNGNSNRGRNVSSSGSSSSSSSSSSISSSSTFFSSGSSSSSGGSSSSIGGSSSSSGGSSSTIGGSSHGCSTGRCGTGKESTVFDVLSKQRQDTRRTDERRQPSGACQNCSVSGKAFPGNSYFDLDEGCRKFKRCICYCNGSWNCPERFAENTCGSSKLAASKEQQSSCRTCSVKGQAFPGNQKFQLTDGCIEYKNCICNCDGSWNCPDTGAKNICNQPGVSKTDDSSCRQCQVKGQTFPGNQYFQLTDGCIEYKNCICNCDGSWNCPDTGAKNICNQPEVSKTDDSSCRQCQVKGQTFPGNQYFQLTDGCIEYKNCICNCDGSWNCPDTGAKNICNQPGVPQTDDSSCRQCQVKGQMFPGNQYFQLTDGCIEYTGCICNCDGSWNCPDNGARNKCHVRQTHALETSSCMTCEVYGAQFPGNEHFQVTQGCIEYRNCICHCNGTWSCPGDTAVNICETKTRVSLGNEGIDASRTQMECLSCSAYGKSFKGGDYFDVIDACFSYRNCICRCNGSWTCDSRYTTNLCANETITRSENRGTYVENRETRREGDNRGTYVENRETRREGENRGTSVENRETRRESENRGRSVENRETRREGDNRGTYVENRGSENRSSILERTDFRNATSSSTSALSTDGQCLFCTAKSKVVRGNTYFELTDGCVEYKNCFCKCDGSWECPPQFAKTICIETDKTVGSGGISSTTCSNCVANGKIVKGNSYFELIDGCTRYTSCRCDCDGKWQCSDSRAQNICFNNATVSDSGCSLCKSSNGLVHQPNSRFKLTEDCIEYNCDCFCNGSWSCPGKRSRWVCSDRCLQCDVEGRKVENNTQFSHRTGCLEYTCDCHCNGSWSCAGKSVRNTCPAGVRDGCNKCRVSATEVYDGESNFVLRQDCLQYKCRCNCDGGYTCPGKDARNVCRGEVLGGCRSCVVSETEIHKGNTDFSMRKDCINYECKCNCDGSWECPPEKARNVCLGEAPGGCRACRVSETEVYLPNSVFDMRKECIHYKCKCNCDGSWSCPGEDARDVCKGEIPGGCKSCVVADEFYPGNSKFEMVKNCVHYKCRCNCDGSYNCPGKTARRVCQAGAVSEAAGCKTCRVSETEQFTGNTTFSIERGCARYECDCRCDGSWQCPPGKVKDVCARDVTVRPSSPTRCNPCKISKDVYPGNTAFKFTRGCSQFDCKCECSGRWTCNHKNRVNICREGEKATIERSLVSSTSDVRKRQDYSATSSDHVSAHSAQRGSAFDETDIRSQEVLNPPSTRTDTAVNTHNSRTDGAVNTQAASSGSNVDSNCRTCYVDGRTIQPNVVFTLDRGCVKYRNCHCHCDGRWQCLEELNRCEATPSPILPQGERSHRTETQSTSSTSSRRREVDSSGWVFVDGVDSSFKTSDGKTGGGYVVQVDTKYSPKYSTRGQGGRQRLEQLELNPSSSSSTSSGSSSSSFSSTFLTSGSVQDAPITSSSLASTSDENKGTSQCLRCQVDTKTYPSGANFDMRRGCVVYKCLCLCSGSYRCRLTSDNECSVQDKQATCSNCLYQGMVFPGNMGFTVREGCEEKQCNCNCDGTHACHSTKTIPGCNAATAHASGLPAVGNFYPVPGGLVPVSTGYITNTGRAVYQSACTTCFDTGSVPVVYHSPVHPASGEGGGSFVSTDHRSSIDPRGTCHGCLVDGQLQKGNTTFTFNKDCIEFDCYCACGGSWKCAGRLAIDCTPGFAPETVPHSTGCRSCNVQGTAYPANARFSLRQDCHEYQCSCNCDGGWSCPAQHPVNLCPTAPARPARGNVMDPQIVRDDTYLADQGIRNHDQASHLSQLRQLTNTGKGRQSDLKTIIDTCYECQVRGVTYQAKSKFFLRDGCIQRICECHCNASWSCLENTVDLCQMASSEAASTNGGQCRDCHVGPDVFVSGNDFQINNGCHQYNCHCHCNGTHVCPGERVRNLCNSDANDSAKERANNNRQSVARIQQSVYPLENGEAYAAGQLSGCKECHVDGQRVESLSTFVKVLGCYESLCNCQCNGNAVCPPSASVNVCELPDKLPMSERKGCQVGRRTHLTRVFAQVENCIQRTCLCHDNGEWSCKRTANDLKVC
jgi:hypothetical protein